MKLLKFGAEWCGPCKTLEDYLDSVVKGNVTIERIDIDSTNDPRQQRLMKSFGIRGVPTLVMVDEDEEMISIKAGLMSKGGLEEWLHSMI
jgi:thioredoxin 1